MSSSIAAGTRTFFYTPGNVQEYFADWLTIQMKARGLSQAELARQMTISPSTVNKWLKGFGTPDTQSCAKLAKALRIPLEDVYRAAGHPSEAAEPSSVDQRYEDRVRSAMAELLGAVVEIPIHEQTASAGFGDEVLEYVYWSAPRVAGRNIVGMKVHGDSMEPDIKDGDTIYVDKDAAPRPGDIVVAAVGPGIVVKYFRDDGRRKFLEGADGRAMDMKAAKIEGVVIQLSRDVR
jgi:SOS-response transcriptional repressor LexA